VDKPRLPGPDRLSWALPGATLALHLAFANRYDFFRDELYFIICGRHPSWGYVDQPPLVPLLSAASQAFGEHLFLLRAIPALAAAATVLVTIALARLIGAGTFGSALAGVAAAIAPMYLGLMTTLGTTSFEPLLWTLIAFLVMRALVEEDPRLWLWAGVVAGIDLEIKYALPLYLVPLLAALLLTGHAPALRRRQVLAGIVLAAAIAAPSAIWQVAHGLPFLEMLRNQAREGKNIVLPPLAFVAEQFKVMNPLLAPLWLAGLVAPFVDARFKPARWLSLAFGLAFLEMLLLHSKDYFLAALYAPMFAVGGAALEEWVRVRWLRAAYVTACVALSAITAPMAMPILSPPVLVAYLRTLHLAPQAAETLRQGALPQTFADMHGWREITARVTEAVHMLPSDEQRRVVILAHNYGEAAALEFYGRDLPPVLTGHNQYFLWGLRGTDPDELIAFNRDVAELKDKCREARELNHFYAAWVMPFEDDSPITLCRGLHPSLGALWLKLKLYY
jgi:4-amino-4-deoxy-L-arabinose transferase-like glycosyltransferase